MLNILFVYNSRSQVYVFLNYPSKIFFQISENVPPPPTRPISPGSLAALAAPPPTKSSKYLNSFKRSIENQCFVFV